MKLEIKSKGFTHVFDIDDNISTFIFDLDTKKQTYVVKEEFSGEVPKIEGVVVKTDLPSIDYKNEYCIDLDKTTAIMPKEIEIKLEEK